MPSVKIEIDSSILHWIIEKISNDNVDNNTISLLNKWINGVTKPTFNQIEDVSKKTHIPFGYFFLKKPPEDELSLIHCRTINSTKMKNPSRNLIDTINIMSNAQEWMAEYNEDEGLDPLPFVGRFKNTDDPSIIAEDIRNELNIEVDWFKNVKHAEESFKYLKNRISDLGILVMQNGIVGNSTNRPLNIEEFRAFTLINEYAPLIFINSKDEKHAKVFSLVHELSHIWLGEDDLFNDNDFGEFEVSKTEQICNAVAADILTPSSIFVEKWNQSGDTEDTNISDIAKYFKCSKSVILRRALTHNFISKRNYDNLTNNLKKERKDLDLLKKGKFKKSGGGNLYNSNASRWDNNFIFALDNSTKSGRTSYLEAYRLTKMKGNTFHKFVDMLQKRSGDNFE